MNIFFLTPDPEQTAAAVASVHVHKMALEAAQMAMTAFHALARRGWARRFQREMGRPPYKATHRLHPMAVWLRASRKNMSRGLAYGLALCDEYDRRYPHGHLQVRVVLEWCRDHADLICYPGRCLTDPPRVVAEDLKSLPLYAAYVAHYRAKLAEWLAAPRKRHLVKGAAGWLLPAGEA